VQGGRAGVLSCPARDYASDGRAFTSPADIAQRIGPHFTAQVRRTTTTAAYG